MSYLWSILAGLMAVGLAILAFRDQRALWWRFRARWYADPEANEPSDAAFTGQRIVLIVLAVLMAIGAVQLYRIQDALSWSDGEVRDAAE